MSVDRLQEKIRKMKSPVAFGMDPMPDRIPPYLLAESREKYGDTVRALADSYEAFGRILIDTLAPVLPAVKFQPVCFEALGAEGMAVMKTLTEYAKEQGLYVIVDTSFCSIESIAETQAKACFGALELGEEVFSPYYSDAATLVSYFGSDGIRPFLPYCKEKDKAVFMLVRTSNKSGREVQDLISGDRNMYTVMADLAMRLSPELYGKTGFSGLGIIVGAPQATILKQLRSRYDRLFFCVAGYGAQGGRAADVQHAFNSLGHGAVICAGRSIICAWQKDEQDAEGRNFAEAALAAAKKMREDILRYVTIY